MHTLPVLTELKLSPEMKHAVNTALESGRAVVVAYVDETGAPRLSYRGSTQAFSDTELAIWVRNPASGILAGTARNPAVSLIYGNFNPDARGFMVFRGRARTDASDEVRRQVYERTPEGERNLDPERKGVALIVELDAVEGFFGGARLQMHR